MQATDDRPFAVRVPRLVDRHGAARCLRPGGPAEQAVCLLGRPVVS